MSFRRSTSPPPLAVGDVIDLTDVDGGLCTRATVERVDDAGLSLRLDGLVATHEGPYRLQRADADGWSWSVEGTGRRGVHPLSLLLPTPGEWQRGQARRSARFATARQVVVCRQPDGRRRNLVCLDVSAGGLRASGHGAPPPIGGRVQVTTDVGSYETAPRLLPAVITRVQQFVYGRFEVGLRFETTTGEQRSHALAWRDEAALHA